MSSKVTGLSFNECLFSGPSITKPLFSILLRYRVDRIAIIPDMEEAFLQITVTEKHRNFIRFFWYKDVENINCNKILTAKLISYCICRLLFGVALSSFILSAILQNTLRRTNILILISRKIS